MEILLPKEEPRDEESEVTEDTRLSDAFSKMRMSQMTKMRKFTKGENFSRFCGRFQEYVYITKIEDRNLYMYFLQNVDDKTYSKRECGTVL